MLSELNKKMEFYIGLKSVNKQRTPKRRTLGPADSCILRKDFIQMRLVPNFAKMRPKLFIYWKPLKGKFGKQ